MEIRKFIVEIHPDGKMTWCECQDPDPYGFIAGGKSSVEKILRIIENRKQLHQNRARQYVVNGNMECGKVSNTSALEDDACIRLIKREFSIY